MTDELDAKRRKMDTSQEESFKFSPEPSLERIFKIQSMKFMIYSENLHIEKPTYKKLQAVLFRKQWMKHRQLQEEFAIERNWNQYHTPRNLLLAMSTVTGNCLLIFADGWVRSFIWEVGEVGELSEIFQWKGEVKEGLPDWSDKDKTHLGQELSDILIYLVRLADKCRIDLPIAVLDKFELNKKKYPAQLVHGSNKKYTEYDSIENDTTNCDSSPSSSTQESSSSDSR